MRELNDLSYEDIGAALATSPAAAKQSVFEARTALLEVAEGREMECAATREAISAGDRRVLRGRKIRAHLRGCDRCRDFEAAIGDRRETLAALAPPLAAPAALALLHGAIGGGAAAGRGAAGTIGAGFAAGAGGQDRRRRARGRRRRAAGQRRPGCSIEIDRPRATSPPATSSPAPPARRRRAPTRRPRCPGDRHARRRRNSESETATAGPARRGRGRPGRHTATPAGARAHRRGPRAAGSRRPGRPERRPGRAARPRRRAPAPGPVGGRAGTGALERRRRRQGHGSGADRHVAGQQRDRTRAQRTTDAVTAGSNGQGNATGHATAPGQNK